MDGDLHLHGLEDDEGAAGLDRVAGRDLDAEHGAGHGRGHRRRAAAGRPLRLGGSVDVRGRSRRRRGKVQPPRLAPSAGRTAKRIRGERRMLGEEGCRGLACTHDRVRDEPAEEKEVRRRARDLRLGERVRQ